MQKVIILIPLLIISLTAAIGQNIAVKSFRMLEGDLDARVSNVKEDQNGDKCAIIKVVTSQQGFVWEGDALGIIDVDKKVGEYWLYVPYGAKRLTIKHDKLGILRDYIYPVSIKEATVYEMVLTTAKVTTIVEEQEIPMQFITITTNPDKADVFINDQYVGITPFSEKLEVGEYSYRIEKGLYHNEAGKIKLTEEERTDLELTLNPNFGDVTISTTPEQGVSVDIDGRPTNKKTPYLFEKLSPGKHRATLKKVMFKPKTIEFEIYEGDRTTLNVTLEPTFATVNITTTPKSNIYIDDVKRGYGNYTGRIMPGLHTFEAKKDKYYTDKKQQEFKIGDTINLSLHPTPKTGEIEITSNPFKANILVDGASSGTTPNTVEDLLIGEYTITLKKEGYETLTKRVNVKEDKTILVDEELIKERDVKYNYSYHQEDNISETPEKSNENITKTKYNGGPGNMFLSVLIPGLGDKRVSGKSGGSKALTVYGLIAGGFASKYLSDIEYQNYHDATLQSDMDKYYENANTYNKLFYILTASGALVWIYDIIWVADKGFKNKRNSKTYSTQFDMNYNPEINGLVFSLNISF